jgi:DNA-binding MarR family transcriptional regulator
MLRKVMPMRARTSAIQSELKQKKPFGHPAEEVAVALLRTADVLRGDLERTLSRSGVTLQQYNVLRILRGSHPEPLPTLEIAERMIERAPGITRLLDRLEAAKLVSRKRCPKDRRRVLCSITATGLATLAQADGPVHATERGRAGRLAPADLATLLALLDRIREDVT